MLLLKKFHKKKNTAQRPRSFVGKCCTDILRTASNNIDMLSMYIFKY